MSKIKSYLQLFKDMSVDDNSSIGHGILDPLVLITLSNSDGLSKADLGEKIYYSRSSHKSSLDKPLMNLIEEGFIHKVINENPARKLGDGAFYYFMTTKGLKLIKCL
ncbi:MAG: hypothetical protein QM478_11545 [Flavobacteriaceae bacterium]